MVVVQPSSSAVREVRDDFFPPYFVRFKWSPRNSLWYCQFFIPLKGMS